MTSTEVMPASPAEEPRVPEVAAGGAPVEGAVSPVIGICCSGGGIRSAAFSLGALQALSRAGKLEGRDGQAGARYLAGVSGGSYIAAAFTLANRFSDRKALDEQPAFREGSPEEEYLRNRCSYLAAGFGGKLRLVTTVLMNFLANLLFVAALLWVPGRLLGWLYVELYPALGECLENCDPFVTPASLWPGAVGAALAGLSIGLVVVRRMFTSAPRLYDHLVKLALVVLAVTGAAFLVLVALPQLLAAGRWLTLETPTGDLDAVAAPGVATGVGLTAALAAALTQVAVSLRSAASLRGDVATVSTWYRSLGQRMRQLVLTICGALLGPLAILIGLLLIIDSAATTQPRIPLVALTGNAAQAFAVLVGGSVLAVLYRFADLTAWSLHPFYKRRLASAFSVQRMRDEDGTTYAQEIDYWEPRQFTDCSPERIKEVSGVDFPELIVCAAANVSDGGQTPPGSAVASFVFTPHEIGGKLVGGMRMAAYEDLIAGRTGSERRRGRLTVMAGVAISGAAIAPSMGRHTRGSLRFLLALANIRLGVWLPNPRRASVLDEHTRTRTRILAFAVPRPHNLLKEVTGRHLLNARFLYTSDGGHYENLGLVELLQRGCTEIYCLDASGGPLDNVSTLGHAIALARTDADLEHIEFDDLDAVLTKKVKDSDAATPATRPFAIGRFRYRDGREGTITYVRAVASEDMPIDVSAYARKDKVFPNHPTASQLYTGERFEAYRVLGSHGASAALAAMQNVPAGA